MVKTASALIGTAGAFVLAWRGRTSHEPYLTGMGDRPFKIAAVIIAVLLALIISDEGRGLGFPPAPVIVIWCTSLAVATLLTYLFLLRVLGYTMEVPVSETRTQKSYIIGGLWLTVRARELRKEGATVQTILKRASYEPDLVWPRLSVGLSEVLVIITYVTLMVSTSIALALGSLLLQRAFLSAQ